MKNRYYIEGDIAFIEIISKGEKFICEIDLEDLNTVKIMNTWHLTCGYVKCAGKRIGKERLPQPAIHRVVMNVTDSNIQIDHIDNNKLNNKKSNLRIATHSENQQNKPKFKKNGSSKYKGVSLNSKGNWLVMINDINYGTCNIGTFTSEIAGANAYNYYAKLYHGEFANLNDVEYIEDWYKYRAKQGKAHSFYIGVRYDCTRNTSPFICKYKGKYIGSFSNELDCAKAYNEYAIKAGDPPHKLNIIK